MFFSVIFIASLLLSLGCSQVTVLPSGGASLKTESVCDSTGSTCSSFSELSEAAELIKTLKAANVSSTELLEAVEYTSRFKGDLVSQANTQYIYSPTITTAFSQINLRETVKLDQSGVVIAMAQICLNSGTASFVDCRFAENTNTYAGGYGNSIAPATTSSALRCFNLLSNQMLPKGIYTYSVECRGSASSVAVSSLSTFVAMGPNVKSKSALVFNFCPDTTGFTSTPDTSPVVDVDNSLLSLSLSEESHVLALSNLRSVNSASGWMCYTASINDVRPTNLACTHNYGLSNIFCMVPFSATVAPGSANVKVVTGTGTCTSGGCCLSNGPSTATAVPSSMVTLGHRMEREMLDVYTYPVGTETIEYEHTATLEYDSSVVVIGHNNFMAQVTNARMIIRLYIDDVVVSTTSDTLGAPGYDYGLSFAWAGELQAGSHHFKVTFESVDEVAYAGYGPTRDITMHGAEILAVRKRM